MANPAIKPAAKAEIANGLNQGIDKIFNVPGNVEKKESKQETIEDYYHRVMRQHKEGQ